MQMAEKIIEEEQQNQEQENGLLFENILCEVRAHNCNDRTKLLIDAINDELKAVMQAITKYSKDGSISIKLNFKCLQANEMMISAMIDSKKPRGQSTGTRMYRDEKGQLYMDDPNQLKLIDARKVQSIRGN